MKITYKELMEQLGVKTDLQGYETQPFQVYDEDAGIICSAEIRVMDGDCDEIEAEIILDKSQKEKLLENEAKFEIVLWFQAKKSPRGTYSIIKCRFEGKDFINEVSDWQNKACRFFKASIRALKNNELPDFDEIKSRTMKNSNAGSGGGSTGGRAPKIKGGQLLNDMKRGGAGF